MRKSQKKEHPFRGEITAFLSLIFILMLSVVGALLESASIQMTKERRRADTALALESVFAEYHQEMLDTYDLFVRFGCSGNVLQSRLDYYGAGNMTHSVKQMEILTDHQGQPFYEQAVRYIKDLLGVEHTPSSGEGYDFSEGSMDLDKEEASISIQLQELLEQEEAELPRENNPIQSVKSLKNKDLLTLVVSEQESLSNRSVETATLPTHRTLEKGNYERAGEGGTVDKACFIAYLTEHFSDFTETSESHVLFYEQEYLLGGYESDKENLQAVCNKILKVRMVTNYIYLLTDAAKQAEAEAMALTLCSLLSVPGITEIVKQGILLAWAYGESIVDVRVLLKQKKVATVKTAETWQLQLANLVSLGTADEVAGEKESLTGLSYQDYLKGFLLIEEKETLAMRSLDLIESNLHIKTDQCMTKVEIITKSDLRRGIRDTFTTIFKYQ